MDPTTEEIAAAFGEMADLLELMDENPFRVRAYRTAATSLAALDRSVAELDRAGSLQDIPGVGKDLAAKIHEHLDTGTMHALDELRGQVPPGVIELTRVPGVGPRTARLLHDRLGTRSLEALEQAARAGKIRGLPGLGARREQSILHGIALVQEAARRKPYAQALEVAQALVDALRQGGHAAQVSYAGSLRRGLDTVGDVDLLAASRQPAKVMAKLTAHPSVAEVVLTGPTRTTVRTKQGLQVDLRVVEPAAWGAALVYFTGSKSHNIHLRKMAQKKSLKLSEYGLFREKSGRRLAGATEEDVYAALGLPWIPPEIREDAGEIEAALEDRLPDLVEVDDLRGDLHCHTDWSDGAHPLEDVAEAARQRGYEYVAITDHSRSLTVAHGLDARRLREQCAAIDRLNRTRYADGKFRVLAGTEVDIKRDGSLDLPDDVLAGLDVVVASLHGAFDLPEAEATARTVRAVSNPHVDVLGHPTTRLLSGRRPVSFDFGAVLEAARKGRTAMEANCQPDRLDLDGPGCRRARVAGVKIVISTDEHRLRDLDHVGLGVLQARRGWVEKRDVLNALSREKLVAYLGGRRGARAA